MFKFIKALGKFTVRMYLREAKRLNKEAQGHNKTNRKLIIEAQREAQKAYDKTAEAARLAVTANKLSDIL